MRGTDRLFKRISNQIQEVILSGQFPPGNLLPSERELQERYGASRTTIRKALSELVASGWAETRPNRGVVSRLGPAPSKSTKVAFIDHRDHVHKTLFFKFHRVLADHRLDLVHVDSQETGTRGALQKAAEEEFLGAFVWSKVAYLPEGALSEVRQRMPVIAVDHSFAGEPSDLVMADHRQGAGLLVDHLVRLGRKRIAISGNFTIGDDAQDRFAGYTIALFENDISPCAHDFVFSSPQPGHYEDTRLLEFRLRQPDRPDAVLVLHDMSVPPVVETILNCGLSVPDDVAVVGFGNDLPFDFGGLGLTTIAMNWDLVAETLLSRLTERLANPLGPYRRILVPTKLVVRGSCGAPATRWDHDPYEISSTTVTRRMRPLKRLHPPPSPSRSALAHIV